jgi:glycerol-3-phosphate dehydrogenase
VTIAGGKLTTWRTMALAAVDAVVSRLGRGGASPASLLEETLPGGSVEHPELERVVAEEMVRHADDVAFRRLPIGHDPAKVRRVLPSIIEGMAGALAWGQDRRDAEAARVITRLDTMRVRLDEALGSA